MNTNRFFKENSAILVALFPLAGYLLAYAYKLGYFLFFNIPIVLLQIKIEDILLFTFIAFIIFFFLSSIIIQIKSIFLKSTTKQVVVYKKAFFGDFIQLGTLIISPGLTFEIFIQTNNHLLWFMLLIAYAASAIIIFYAIHIYSKNNGKGFFAFKAYYEALNTDLIDKAKEDIVNKKPISILNRYLGLFILFLVIVLISFVVGYSNLFSKPGYYFYNQSNKTYILISSYNDDLLMESITKKNFDTTGDILILDKNTIGSMKYIKTPKINKNVKRST